MMESIIGIIIWVIVLIVIISRTIRQIPVPKKKEEERKEEEITRFLESIFTGTPVEEPRIPGEPEEVKPEVQVQPQIEIKSLEPTVKIETVAETMPLIKEEPFEEPRITTGILKTLLPKDMRTAIILREILGPPKALM